LLTLKAKNAEEAIRMSKKTIADIVKGF
jgi:hypothetical protein